MFMVAGVFGNALSGAALADGASSSVAAKGDKVPVWKGFSYKWKEHPHRFSLVASRFEGATHEMGLKIGACPEDEGQFEVPYTVLEPGALQVVRGRTAAIATSGKIEAWQSGSQKVTVNVTGLGSGSSAVVLLNGVRFRSRADDLSNSGAKCNFASAIGTWFMNVATGCPQKDCKDWDSGWHFAGARASVSEARVAAASVSFTVDVGVKPGESPDAINGGDCKCYGADWPAKRPTRYDVEVDYVVVAGEKGALKTVTFLLSGATSKATTEWRASPSKKVVGATGMASAFAGVRGFKAEVRGTKSGVSGRYVRELGLALPKFTYASRSGTGTVTGNLAFSNKSPFPEKWTVKAELHGVMVQARDSATKTKNAVVRGSVTNTSTNTVRTPLDL